MCIVWNGEAIVSVLCSIDRSAVVPLCDDSVRTADFVCNSFKLILAVDYAPIKWMKDFPSHCKCPRINIILTQVVGNAGLKLLHE